MRQQSAKVPLIHVIAVQMCTTSYTKYHVPQVTVDADFTIYWTVDTANEEITVQVSWRVWADAFMCVFAARAY